MSVLNSAQPVWFAEVRSDALVDPASDKTELGLAGINVPATGRITVDVALASTREGVLVTGTIKAPWQGPCSRCTEAVGGETVLEIEELFSTEPREGEQYQLAAEHVDLTPMVREAILLELPIHAVPCPNPEPCVNLVLHPDVTISPADAASAALEDPSSSVEGGSRESGETADRDPRWAALDVLREDVDN